MLADCQYIICVTLLPFERRGRVRIGVAEVEGLKGVGGGVIELIWLWKCVEKSKVRPFRRASSSPTHPCKTRKDGPPKILLWIRTLATRRGLAAHHLSLDPSIAHRLSDIIAFLRQEVEHQKARSIRPR